MLLFSDKQLEPTRRQGTGGCAKNRGNTLSAEVALTHCERLIKHLGIVYIALEPLDN